MGALNYRLEQLNDLADIQAKSAFSQCCTASRWVEEMAAHRPFTSKKNCLDKAHQIWQTMHEDDWLEAFAGHPKIGDLNSLRAKYAHTKALASGEQSSVNEASEDTLRILTEENERYEQQNGFIFIVCATGKSAEDMLVMLRRRLENTRDQELKIAADQQMQITAIRLEKLLPDD